MPQLPRLLCSTRIKIDHIKEYVAVHELFTTGRLENSVKVYFNTKEPLDAMTIKLKYGLLTYWDVSQVTHMNNLFWGCQDFNESIEEWDVSNVITMDYMFQEATSFNQPLNKWNINNVKSMESMFSCMESLLINHWINGICVE